MQLIGFYRGDIVPVFGGHATGRGYVLRDDNGEVVHYDDKVIMDNGGLVIDVHGVQRRMPSLQNVAFDPGRCLGLFLEPDNPKDPDAVAVWDAHKRLQIGYVPAELAPQVAARLRAGEPLYALCLMEWVNALSQRIGIRMLIAPDTFKVELRN